MAASVPAAASAARPGGGAGSGIPAGNQIANRAPPPGRSPTTMWPPCAAMMLLHKDRPIPVPTPVGLVVKKGSKIRSRSAGGMPGPLSAISSCTPPELPVRLSQMRRGVGASASACCALIRRLRITRCSRSSSPDTTVSPLSIRRSTSIPAVIKLWWSISSEPSTRRASSTGPWVPVRCRAIARKLLTMRPQRSAAARSRAKGTASSG